MTGKETREQKAAQEVWRKGYDTKHPDMVCPRGQSSSLVFLGPPSSGHLRTAVPTRHLRTSVRKPTFFLGPSGGQTGIRQTHGFRGVEGRRDTCEVPGQVRGRARRGASEPSPGGAGAVAGEGDPDEV